MKRQILLTLMAMFLAGHAESATLLKAREMNRETWKKLESGSLGEVIIEFRNGDELPLTFEASGDLVETRVAPVVPVFVKKDFWVKLDNEGVRMSFDNQEFKKIPDMIVGSLSASVNGDENSLIANTIRVFLDARVK